DAARRGLPEPRGDGDELRRRVLENDRLAFERRLADKLLAERELGRRAPAALEAVARDQPQRRLAVVLGDEERALLGADERRELVHDQPADLLEVALTLQHPG